jgi:hypothetical protein
MKVLIKGILLILSPLLMLYMIDGTEIAHGVILLNTSNSNSTLNNDTSIINNTTRNSTSPSAINSIPEDNDSGSIASLPGKCLGSALCPD